MVGGRRVGQEALFQSFSLEKRVPADRPLRATARSVELSDVRRQVEPFHGSVGRPPVDPEPTVGVPLVGCCRGVRSERRLCEEAHPIRAHR